MPLMSTVLSQSAKQVLLDNKNMETLLKGDDDNDNDFDNDDVHPDREQDDSIHHLITPPRFKQSLDPVAAALYSPLQSSESSPIVYQKTSPGFSASTSPTYTALTDKSKGSSFLYTYPENNNHDDDADVEEEGSYTLNSSNPSGMVIQTQYAKEAIEDPTWLDSDEEEEGEESGSHDPLRNRSLLSGTTVSGNNLEEECARSSTSLPEKAWSICTGSSISVGSCGLGRLSLSDGGGVSQSGSLSLGSGVHSVGGKIMLSQIDVVDMGVESVSSGESGDYVLDYLYDLDRRAYDLSDDEDGGVSLNAIRDGKGHRNIHLLDLDDDLSLEDLEDDDCNSSAYLPQHLMSPPRLSRKVLKDNVKMNSKYLSDDRTEEVDVHGWEKEDNSCIVDTPSTPTYELNVEPVENCIEADYDVPEVTVVTPATKLIDVGDVELECVTERKSVAIVSPLSLSCNMSDGHDSGSSTDETNICSNCSPSAPNVIMNDLAGIVRGDILLSIMDCPGSKTRKKRQSRGGPGVQSYPWGQHALKNALSCMRSIRKKNQQISPDQVDNCSFSLGKCGKSLRNQQANRKVLDCVTPKHSKSLLSGSFSISSATKSPHRSQLLESEALEHLRNDDFENAKSVFHQILAIYDEYCNFYEEGSEEYHEYNIFKGLTLFNIGLVHLFRAEYTTSLDYFHAAEESCSDSSKDNQLKCFDLINLKGLANYGLGQFESAIKHWNSALQYLKKSNTKDHHALMSEILNNLGCAHFETGTCTKALKYLKESLEIQKNVIYEGKEDLYHSSLMKFATTRSNIGYVYLRSKHPTEAIKFFEESLIDQNICLKPNHPLVIGTMDHLAIAFVKKGSNAEAIKLYSKMLTAKIEAQGFKQEDCVTTLTKLSLLQLKRNDKKASTSCMNKIQSCLSSCSDPCEMERFEKLLKASKFSGLTAIHVAGALTKIV